MKILQLISSAGLYGAERVLLELASFLHAREDAEVTVGALEHDTDQAEPAVLRAARELGLDVMSFPCAGMLDARLPLVIRRHLSRVGVDILHCHNYKSDLYGAAAAAGTRTRLVATCHGWLTEGVKLRAFEAADKLCLQTFDRVVAVSGPLLEEVHAVGISEAVRIDNGMFVELPGGDAARRDARQRFGLEDDTLVLVTVGRLDRWKAHHVLLNAMDRLRRHNVRAHLLLVGDGERREELERLVPELGLAGQVTFTGYLDDITPALAAADIFALSSIKEGLPMVLLEAMGAGLPIVATTVGAIPEALDRGRAGMLVSPGCPDGLCAGILSLAEAPDRREDMAHAARRRYMERYSRAAMGEQYLALYQDLLAR